jgi:hypothetical protein
MGDTVMAPPSPDEVEANSFFDRALGVFISPGRTFASIVRRPDFLAPLIVMTLASVVLVEAMLQKIGAAQIVRHALENSGRASQMTPEQLDQAVHRAAFITALGMRVFGIIGVPIFLLIIAATGLFIVNVVFGASADFKACFSVVCYANLVLLIGVVLGLVIVLFGDVEQFNAENPIPSTVGFFLNQRETSKPLYALASHFDIFRVWFIILSAAGLSAATQKRVGTLGICLTYFGIWVIIVLGHVGFAALMG